MTRSGLFISAASRPVASSSRKVWTDCRSTGRTCNRISPRGGPERQRAIASFTVDAGNAGHSGARRSTSVSRHPATHRTGRDHASAAGSSTPRIRISVPSSGRAAPSGGASGTMTSSSVPLTATRREARAPACEASRTKPTTRLHRRIEACGSRSGGRSSVGSGSRPDPTSRRRAVVRAGRSRTRPGWPSASTRRPARGVAGSASSTRTARVPSCTNARRHSGSAYSTTPCSFSRGPPSVRGNGEGQRHGREDPGEPASLRSGPANRWVTSLVPCADLVPAVAPTRTGQIVYSRERPGPRVS